MKILAIETSCDDTGVAVLEIKNKKLKIISNLISSQVKLHQKYGGVYPSLAKREHERNLPVILKRSLRESKLLNSKCKMQNAKFNLIAVTAGPGLEPCLWVGVNFAKDLAKKLKIPLVPVNHIEAHILVNFIRENSKFEIRNSKLFPAVCLVVSGGHTQLILMKGIGKYRILGETQDDAAGECLDKVARILGLGYPGGPVIAAEAAKFEIRNSKFEISLPRPMIHQKNYDFSFSGLKTAVLYNFKSRRPRVRKSKKYIKAMSAETQQAIIDVLIKKTLKAAKDYRAKSVILGGGVVANDELRKQFKFEIRNSKFEINLLIPPKNLCTDNALMIGMAAFLNRQRKKNWKKIEANANLRIDGKL
jgi:N6-L-threonylcarbamoyladenine synthase